MSYTKEIAPHFEIIGKRKKLTGFDGVLRDGEQVIHCQEYRTQSDAEIQLDLLTYELLSDHFEHGLIDEPPPGFPDDDDGTEDGGGPPDSAISLLTDVAQVLDMALGSTSGAVSVVSELRRVRARVAQAMVPEGWKADFLLDAMDAAYDSSHLV